MYSMISLKALKQQFSKMVDAGNMQVPESSSSTLTTARTYWKFRLKWFKISVFLREKDELFRGFLEIFGRKKMWYLDDFLRNSGKIFGQFLSGICGKAYYLITSNCPRVVLRSHYLFCHATLLHTKALRDLHITPVEGWNKIVHFASATLVSKMIQIRKKQKTNVDCLQTFVETGNRVRSVLVARKGRVRLPAFCTIVWYLVRQSTRLCCVWSFEYFCLGKNKCDETVWSRVDVLL